MNNKKSILDSLYKTTFAVVLMSLIASSIGNVIDGMIIGKFLGNESIAAFGFTIPYQKFVMIFPSLIALGMQIICTKKLSAGKIDELNGTFSLAMSLSIGGAFIVLAAVFIFPEQIANILGVPENDEVFRAEVIDYLQAFSLGLPAMAFVIISIPVMQLDSDRQRTVTAIIIESVTNVVGDLLNVFYLDAGMWGIGLATSASYFVAAAFLAMHFFKTESQFKFSPANIKIAELKNILLNGMSPAMGRAASMLQANFLNHVAVGIGGNASVAALAIWNNLLSLIETLPKSQAQAMQQISGMLIGESDRTSILRLLKIAIKFSLQVSLLVAVILIFAAPLIINLYISGEDIEVTTMSVEAVRWMAMTLAVMAINQILYYFYAAYGRFTLVSANAVADNILFIVPLVLVMTHFFGMTGIWAAFLMSKLAMLLAIIVGVWIYNRKISFRLEDLLLLPEDFDSQKNPQINVTVTSQKEVEKLSEQVQNFCENNGVDGKRSLRAAICIEEMARNIVEHGFADGKKHSVDIRVIIQGDEVTIRLRDDCRPFNPKKWHEIHNPENKIDNIGIRMVFAIARDVKYISILKLNCLIIKI